MPSVGDCGGSTFEWRVLSLRPNRQIRVRDALRRIAIEEFLPTIAEEVRWSDRRKIRLKPLFPGYIFVRCHSEEWPAIAAVPGVVAVVGRIADAELENFRRAIAAAVRVVPCAYVAGSRVTVKTGPFAGVSGIVHSVKGTTSLTIPIEILGRAVRVAIDIADLEPAKK